MGSVRIVSGPHDIPPLSNFKTNPLLAIGGGKTSFGLSAPQSESNNDAITTSLYPATMKTMDKFFGSITDLWERDQAVQTRLKGCL